MIIHDYSLSEARRKKQYRRHVSREDTYDEDMTHHNYGDAILSDIGEVMKTDGIRTGYHSDIGLRCPRTG